MIFIKRDPKNIPPEVLAAAEKARTELEALPEDQRSAYIDKKANIWRDFKQHLGSMSHMKCWYSEADDPQSTFDVDHYRPKKKAIRDTQVSDGGYPWLAFDWMNFRYSAVRSNRLTTNEETAETDGKGNWFPLLPGSVKATWDDRCEDAELPVLLDPTLKHDVRLVDISTDGRIAPSPFCSRSERDRVDQTARILGRNLPRLTSARLRAIRDTKRTYESMIRIVDTGQSVKDEMDHLHEKTHPRSPFSLAARSALIKSGAGQLCATPEDG